VNKCEVVAVANRWPEKSREPYYNHTAWLESLRRFGTGPTVLGLGEPWGGLMTIPRRVRNWLREGRCKSEILIFSNVFDVIFTAPPDEVADRWGGGDEVTFNAEKDLFPRADLKSAFRDVGTPWRYLNSGMYIGKPGNILAMLEAMYLDDVHDDHIATDDLHGKTGQWVHVNDQGWFQFLYAAHPVPMTLDYKCRVFQCFSSCTWDEFDLSKPGKVINKVTGTEPPVIHCNGGSKDHMLPILCKHCGLTP
jgi:hypothetical protein